MEKTKTKTRKKTKKKTCIQVSGKVLSFLAQSSYMFFSKSCYIRPTRYDDGYIMQKLPTTYKDT